MGFKRNFDGILMGFHWLSTGFHGSSQSRVGIPIQLASDNQTWLAGKNELSSIVRLTVRSVSH